MSSLNSLSVLIPNYNHGKFIKEAVDSVLSQSLCPNEIIIIDDASTDASIKIVQEFIDKCENIKLFRNDINKGVVYNLNKLIDLATSEYIHFLAADDKVLPGFYLESMQLLNKYPNAGLCSTLTLTMNNYGISKGLLTPIIISNKPSFINPKKAIKLLQKYGPWIYGNTVIYKKKVLVEIGGYSPELGSFCDGFIQQVIALKYGVCYIPKVYAAWRHLDNNYSRSTTSNPELSFPIIKHAKKLMESYYKDIFPAYYINLFEKSMFLLIGINAWENIRLQKNVIIKDFFPISIRKKTPIDAIFRLIFYMCNKIENIIIKISLSAKIGIFWFELTKKIRKVMRLLMFRILNFNYTIK